jgi:hypothetical protein
MKNLEQLKKTMLTDEQVKDLSYIKGGSDSTVKMTTDDKRRERPGTTRS